MLMLFLFRDFLYTIYMLLDVMTSILQHVHCTSYSTHF